jgi:hypothetical protein
MVSFSGATVAGQMDGNAPPASFSGVLNGRVNLSNAQFGDLALEAGNGGRLDADNIGADNISVHTLGGGVVNIEGADAETLEIFAELGGFVNLKGGNFGEIDVTLETDSMMAIYGHSFTYLGTPVEMLPADAFVEETGELRTIGGDLAGILRDGAPFSMTYSRQFFPLPGARVFLVQVPEPATVTLMLTLPAGLIGIRRSRGRQA